MRPIPAPPSPQLPRLQKRAPPCRLPAVIRITPPLGLGRNTPRKTQDGSTLVVMLHPRTAWTGNVTLNVTLSRTNPRILLGPLPTGHCLADRARLRALGEVRAKGPGNVTLNVTLPGRWPQRTEITPATFAPNRECERPVAPLRVTLPDVST